MKSNFNHLFVATFAYFIAGKLGLFLAIPPGFASAVWPAAGVGLASILLLNRSMAISGIGLGSFLLNLSVSTNWFTNLSLNATLVPMGIAIGAMLQAAAGFYLFKHFIHGGRLIDTPKRIFYFIFIIAPVSCLIAPTVGVSSLLFSNIISIENFWFSWLTWWSGDTIGVVLFAPLLITLFPLNQKVSKTRKLQVAIPTIFIFAGILILFFISSDYRLNKLNTDINKNGLNLIKEIEERLRISMSKLTSYNAFYNASDNISLQEFNLFSQILLKDDDVFQGVGWTEIVTKLEREKYESQIKNEGFPNFTFTETDLAGNLVKAKERDLYYPVLYIYPFEKNVKAFGLNLGANKTRLNVLEKSKRLSTAIATPPLRLVQELESQLSYILYLPVFKETEKNIESNFYGYISGVFRLDGVIGDLPKQIQILNNAFIIKDVTNKTEPVVLISSLEKPVNELKTYYYNFEFGGRKIEVEFYATKKYQLSSKDWNSWSILTFGLLITSLLQSFILIVTGNAENTKKQINIKTRELKKAKKIAEDANASKSDFTANMSHEIRTPLNAIIGLINLCLKSKLSEKQGGYLQKAKLASQTLLSLINQTLDYSKIEAGKLELENIEFDFTLLIQKIYAIFSIQASEKSVGFDIEIPKKIPNRIYGDPLRLEQVLLNLSSNSLKFTSEGKVTIAVELVSISETNVILCFKFNDTGIGMTLEQQKLLFNPYQQADSSTNRKYGGTGLGLTISKQLVELMGGCIFLKSEIAKGTEFTIHISFKLAKNYELFDRNDLTNNFSLKSQNSGERENVVRDVKVQNRLKLEGVNILMAEDIEINQMIAEEILTEHGATVTVVSNGLEAVNKVLEVNTFDIILMDIQMPEMDGYQATRLIRENPQLKNIPIVAMTANAMESDIQACKSAGMNDHIGKPIEEEDVLNKIIKNLR